MSLVSWPHGVPSITLSRSPVVGCAPCHPARTACSGPSTKTRQEKHHKRDFCAWTLRQPAAVEHPRIELTSTVFWKPSARSDADRWCCKMLSIKVSTLFISEVSLLLGTRLCSLQDLNFILRPIQYLPPFLELMKGKRHTGCIILCFSSVL